MKRAPNKLRLTDLIVRRLKPATAPYLAWDTYQRCLAVRVQPKGTKFWKVIYSRGGRPRWFTIGDASVICLSDARQMAGEVMLDVARGRDPQAERRAERGKDTLADLAERYLEQHAKRKNKSWEQADYLVRRHLLPRLGKLRAADVSKADVRGAIERITSPTVANQTLAAASAIFSWAIAEEIGGVKSNPCSKVARHKLRSRERVLSASELPLVWKRIRLGRGRIDRPQADPPDRAAPRRGCAHAARAHQGRLVGDAGRPRPQKRLAGHKERQSASRVAAQGRTHAAGGIGRSRDRVRVRQRSRLSR